MRPTAPQIDWTSRILSTFLTGILVFHLVGDALAQANDASQIGPPIPPALRARIARKNAAAKARTRVRPGPVARPTPAVTRSTAQPKTSSSPRQVSSSPRQVSSTPAKGSGKFAPVLPPKDYSPPVLFIGQKRHDFGSVFQGEEVVHKFVVENKGGADLVLQRIKPSCGCTYVDHDRLIKPGEKGHVTLKINTKRLRAGTQSKSADVFSNDPNTPKDKIYISGTVTTIFELDPKYPRIESPAGIANPSTTIKLKKTVEGDFKITNVSKAQTSAAAKDLPARLATELEPIDDSNYNLVVTALTKEGEKARNFYEKLAIDVEGPNGKTFQQEVSVTVRFKDRISVTPRTVWFRRNEVQAMKASIAAAGGDPATGAVKPEIKKAFKTVKLKSEVENFKFNITKVETTDDHFNASQTATVEGTEYEIKIELDHLPQDATIRSLKGDVIVHTDDPANPQIKFRVIAYL